MALRAIKANERVAIAGKTGTGKTFLAKHLTRGLRRFVLIDSKGTLDNWNTVPWDNESAKLLAEGEPVRVRVLSPIVEKPEEYRAYFDAIFKAAYDAGDVTVYVDEVYAVTQNGIPAHLGALYTRGRELGIGVWAAMQRPTFIPLFVLSEADHLFCFFLQLEKDRRRMSEFMGEEVLEAANDEHGFYYARSQDRHPTYVREFNAGGKT